MSGSGATEVGLCVIDTSVWIERLVNSPLGQRLVTTWPDREACVVPTIVQLELAKWLLRERGEDITDQVMAFTQKCVVAPLDTPTARLAADLHRQYKLATADAIVYATAIRHGAELLSCDAHFAGLPQVRLYSKQDAA